MGSDFAVLSESKCLGEGTGAMEPVRAAVSLVEGAGVSVTIGSDVEEAAGVVSASEAEESGGVGHEAKVDAGISKSCTGCA